MKPLSDEELILYYYGESRDRAEIERRLADSTAARESYRALRAILDLVDEPEIPEPPTAEAAAVWRRLAPKLANQQSATWTWKPWQQRRRWALAGAMAVLLVVTFLAGRYLPRQEAGRTAGLSADGKERILLVTVAGHLERTEMLLLELVNARQDGTVDLSVERRLAAELNGESRLYRQAAKQAGQPRVAALLNQLERLLVELSHGPDEVASDELEDLQLRLEEGNFLFKVRVVGSRLRQETGITARPEPGEPITRDI
jgi:hypothetical protein